MFCLSLYSGVADLTVFFFFQAEDGIRDLTVTGVQTCALPISRHIDIGRTAVRWVVFEAAVLGRVVRWCDDDAVRQVFLAATVVDENGPRDDGRRRDAGVALDDRLDPVRRQHFEGSALGRRRERVGVLYHVERAVDALAPAVVADGLGDRRDVGLGGRCAER